MGCCRATGDNGHDDTGCTLGRVRVRSSGPCCEGKLLSVDSSLCTSLLSSGTPFASCDTSHEVRQCYMLTQLLHGRDNSII